MDLFARKENLMKMKKKLLITIAKTMRMTCVYLLIMIVIVGCGKKENEDSEVLPTPKIEEDVLPTTSAGLPDIAHDNPDFGITSKD